MNNALLFLPFFILFYSENERPGNKMVGRILDGLWSFLDKPQSSKQAQVSQGKTWLSTRLASAITRQKIIRHLVMFIARYKCSQ